MIHTFECIDAVLGGGAFAQEVFAKRLRFRLLFRRIPLNHFRFERRLQVECRRFEGRVIIIVIVVVIVVGGSLSSSDAFPCRTQSLVLTLARDVAGVARIARLHVFGVAREHAGEKGFR